MPLEVAEFRDQHMITPLSTDAPGQYAAYFHEEGFLALPSSVLSRR